MNMNYEELVRTFSNRPFFETGDLLTLFGEREEQIMPRLSRWVQQNKVVQLRRGKYLLPDPYQKHTPHFFYISNYLYSPSYISLFTALEYYRLIPEHTPMIQAVTTRDTKRWRTPFGSYHYHHLKINRFAGYRQIQLGDHFQQRACIASPEKALIDVCLLNPGEWKTERWRSLRLQNTETLNPAILSEYCNIIPSRKLSRGVQALIQHLAEGI
jgi:predicted transcriptional regulator of viral defense system